MSDQQNQEQNYQSIPPTNEGYPPVGSPPNTPTGTDFPPAGYPPRATFSQNPSTGTGYPPNTAFQPGPGYQPAQPFPLQGSYPPPSQLLSPPPPYRFYFSENKMRRYFHPAPRRPLLCMLGGIFCLFISPLFLLLFFLPLLAGLTLMTVGLIWLIFKYVSRPNAEQYRGWLEERQRYLVDEAHRKAFLGNTVIDGNQLFIFKGSVEPGTTTAKNYKEVYRKYSNLGPHYSVNTYSIVFLTKDNIIVLSSEINALNQMWTTTEVRYYYYEHVSGVLIADKVLEVNPLQVTQARLRAQTFGLLIDSGEFVGSDTVISMHIENASGATVSTKDNDELIQRLISLLKDHKTSRLAALRENEALSGMNQ